MQGLKGKPYALFCSHGGGGRVRDIMVSLFRRMGTQVTEPIAPRGWPRPDVLEQCKALGRALAETASRQVWSSGNSNYLSVYSQPHSIRLAYSWDISRDFW
jgi:hypothetical protein